MSIELITVVSIYKTSLMTTTPWRDMQSFIILEMLNNYLAFIIIWI